MKSHRALVSFLLISFLSACHEHALPSHALESETKAETLEEFCQKSELTDQEQAALTWLQARTMATSCNGVLQRLAFERDLMLPLFAIEDKQPEAFDLLLNTYKGSSRVTGDTLSDLLYSLALMGHEEAFLKAWELDPVLAGELDLTREFGAAVHSGSLGLTTRILKSSRVDINAANGFGTPLYVALEKGNVDIVRLLLNDSRILVKESDLKWTHENFYGAAVKGGSPDAIRLLSAFPGADVNSQKYGQELPLVAAIRGNKLDCVKALLENPALDVNNPASLSDTPLNAAILSSRPEIVSLLIADPRIDINLVDDYRGTPLMVAAFQGEEAIVQMLLADARVNKSPVTESGTTLLHQSAAGGMLEFTRQLIREGADVNAVNRYGWTPLIWAAFHKQSLQVLELLDSPFVRVGLADGEFGRTVLHWAAYHGMIDVVRVVLERNLIDVTRQDLKFRTALDLARTQGHEAIAKLLREHH